MVPIPLPTKARDAKASACPRCVARGKTWKGDAPKCAFASGVFSPDNWNCATANDLRALCSEEKTDYNDDQRACIVTGAKSLHVVVTWYKRRGKTEGAWMVTNPLTIEPLTLEEAERVITAKT